MYAQERYILMTLDPVHIGTGGYRLGRVDNSIVREPGTNLPKIPGTSLSGAIRQYAAYRYEKPQCAGQGGHCGQPTCPICYTFGSVTGEGEKQQAHAGIVSTCDAHILLFPVHSMAGPVWVSTKSRLFETGFIVTAPDVERGKFATTLPGWNKSLNLGWLLLTWEKGDIALNPTGKLQDETAWKAIAERLVLVDDGLFSQIVNSNLEVRTSVSINPLTGAAKKGALFTYEAIPRATWLVMDAVMDDYRGAFPSKERLQKWLRKNGTDFGSDEHPNREELAKKGWKDESARDALELYEKASLDWQSPATVVSDGLKLAELLGIGGMGTRGFGRVRLIDGWTIEANGGNHG